MKIEKKHIAFLAAINMLLLLYVSFQSIISIDFTGATSPSLGGPPLHIVVLLALLLIIIEAWLLSVFSKMK